MTDLRQGVSQSVHDVLDVAEAMNREGANAARHLASARARLIESGRECSRLDLTFAAAHLIRAVEILDDRGPIAPAGDAPAASTNHRHQGD